jgi:hypothetical protein
MHELDLPVLQDVAADLAYPGFERGDRAGAEARVQRVADLGVARRVHREHHQPHHLELMWKEVFQHHPSDARREELWIP